MLRWRDAQICTCIQNRMYLLYHSVQNLFKGDVSASHNLIFKGQTFCKGEIVIERDLGVKLAHHLCIRLCWFTLLLYCAQLMTRVYGSPALSAFCSHSSPLIRILYVVPATISSSLSCSHHRYSITCTVQIVIAIEPQAAVF